MAPRLILTNAHVVADSTFIQVKRHGSGSKYTASIQAIGHEVDLALLSVEDAEFWSTPTEMLPLEFHPGLPELQSHVAVVGFPQGGDNTSITKGCVSRVEITQYIHAASALPGIQIDAAINPGNSGGPTLSSDDLVVGVAFQNLPSADSIGYIIPNTVVHRFLSETASNGYYPGYVSLGIMVQALENKHLRRALGMNNDLSGVLVSQIAATSSAASVIKPGDVLLEFDGTKISNDGTVSLRSRERIYFSALISLRPVGSTAYVKLLRNGHLIEQVVTLNVNKLLVPTHQYDELPRYFIYAGLVFVPLVQPYLHEYGENWHQDAPKRLYEKAMHRIMERPGQEIVILSQVLSDDVNSGYQSFANSQVLRVGEERKEILNLQELVEYIQGQTAGFIKLELEDNRLVVIDVDAANEAASRISDRYRLPSF